MEIQFHAIQGYLKPRKALERELTIPLKNVIHVKYLCSLPLGSPIRLGMGFWFYAFPNFSPGNNIPDLKQTQLQII
jgi:hypothetical protein